MAKKKTKNKRQQSFLSPEKYIQTKARELSIYECWVNEEWQSAGKASIIIARQHRGGSVSFVNILVDLLCMGIEDTFYRFNLPLFQYEEEMANIKQHQNLVQIDYSLAHNIIFSGYEYALELELEAHKDFEKTIVYFLEEDNEDIELIDIECGKNGKPVILRHENNFEHATKSYQKICNKIGAENIDLFDADEIEESQNEEEEEWLEPEDVTHYLYTTPERELQYDINHFLELDQKIAQGDNNVANELHNTTKRIFYNHFGYEAIEDTRDNIFAFLDIDVASYPIPAEVLGFDPLKYPDKLDIVNESMETLQEEGSIDLPNLINQHPEIPFFTYYQIIEKEIKLQNGEIIVDEESGGFDRQMLTMIDQALKKYPDYPLLKLVKEQYLLKTNQDSEFIQELFEKRESLSDLFSDREWIHPYEFITIVNSLFNLFINRNDVLSIDSLTYCLEFDYQHFMTDLSNILITNIASKPLFVKQVIIEGNDFEA